MLSMVSMASPVPMVLMVSMVSTVYCIYNTCGSNGIYDISCIYGIYRILPIYGIYGIFGIDKIYSVYGSHAVCGIILGIYSMFRYLQKHFSDDGKRHSRDTLRTLQEKSCGTPLIDIDRNTKRRLLRKTLWTDPPRGTQTLQEETLKTHSCDTPGKHSWIDTPGRDSKETRLG